MESKNIIKMGYVIQDYLITQNLENAKPKDVMPILIEKGFFEKDYRNGLPLRNLLRQLDYENMLYLLPQVSVERKDKNRYWYFNAIRA
ncbi:hypothetical protein LB456_03055 [Psychroflexus sp. CAK57W]|uniref:hypothetical protein n=1 Tax=Psychroflexus curvus TaxID=2873595 RepID=UPI001CCA28F9|nr:hypothetical protein [Psychroflexus curvus]MBZ9786425.1 hypothetical protein [Psychroflexus curvus]